MLVRKPNGEVVAMTRKQLEAQQGQKEEKPA